MSSSSGSSKLKFVDVRDLVLSEEIRKEILVNHQPQYCIQSQEEGVQAEEADATNQRRGGPSPEIVKVLTARRLSSVGIVGRQGTTRTSARMHRRDGRRKTRQT